MKHTIADAPKRNKYPWHLLIDIPAGKSIRVEFPLEPLYLAENARSGAIAYCHHHNIRCATKRILENGVYALYVWRI